MTTRFKPSEWATVLPRRRSQGIFASPYLEPASIVSRETGDDLKECLACGQLREGVVTLVLDEDHGGSGDLCSDCRQKYGL